MISGNRLKIQQKNSMPFLNRYIGTPILTFLIRFLYDLKIYDCNSGMRILRLSSFKNINFFCKGMEFASEIFIKSKLNNLKVKEITNYGAFLDTGGDKDLLLPFSEQSKKVEQGKGYIVAIIVDELTERPIATQKYRKYINEDTAALKAGQEVDLLLTHFTTLGANVIIENEYEGLIYSNQIFKRLKVGDQFKGFIKEIRPNGKVDVVIQKQGVEAIQNDTEIVINYLKLNEGYALIGDFSEPNVIYRELEDGTKLKINLKKYQKYIKNQNKQDDVALDGMQGPNFKATSCGISKAAAKQDKKDWSKK
jgi:predicted RNA-binding protein (virulence factor B family)